MRNASAKIDGFGEGNVAVVVALDEEDRRAPRADGRKRRRFPSESRGIGAFRGFVRRGEGGNLRVPIVDAVHIDAGSEEIGGAGEAESGQVAAIAAAPQADARGIDVGARAEIESCAFHVVELAGTGGAVVERFAKIEAVADAAAIVHGEDDVAAAGEVLIHGVGVAVIKHVVKAEKHLAARSAVEKAERGMTRAIAGIARQKELSVNLHPVDRPRE